MSIDTILDEIGHSCTTCQRDLRSFLAYENASFTLGVLFYPQVARHLLDCETCARTADLIWEQWHPAGEGPAWSMNE